jgi:GH15 family glucan-1,4-alpha-glucosidase
VALDRGVRLALKRSFPAPLDQWLKCRDIIYEDVFDKFWSRERKAFMQFKGSDSLDASSLLMPLVRFISPRDPRWLSTLRQVEENLVYDSLVYRYRIGKEPVDGLKGKEGTFNMCTFWFTECLSRAGDGVKARFFFEKMLGYASHLGLYSEELGPRAEHLGNFPQAFTHLALISAAYDIDRRLPNGGDTSTGQEAAG